MPLANGDTVGPYQILEKLGQGGMATVYKAYHADLDRYVALKILHSDLYNDPSFAARFQREARLVAKLEHPNIVPVHDYARHDNYPYLVMKYIEGETLKARLVRAPLSPEEIKNIVTAVGSAIAYAHQEGILHRDIKPSNVLLADNGRIYLADFGLARIAQDSTSTLSGDTIIGTPQYISPEQAVGKRELDEGTDIYSFGVMLYEMVVGQVPFDADTPFSIIHDHIYSPLPPPRSVNPNVPEKMEQVLVKALAKERADRYGSIPGMVSAFLSAGQSEPLQRAPAAQPDHPVEEQTPPPAGTDLPITEASPGRGKKRTPWLAAIPVLAGLCCLALTLAASRGLAGWLWKDHLQPLLAGPALATVTPASFQADLCTGEQTWLQREAFPGNEISYCWEQGHYLTDLVYTNGEWTVVMSGESDYTDQAYVTGVDFPASGVKEYWDQDFYITDAFYGNGKWIVIMSEGTALTDQSYITNSSLPEDDIRWYHDQGYRITALGYGGGTWAVIMSKGTGINYQSYFTSAEFPAELIRDYWDAGYDITSMAYGDRIWVIVMSKGVFSKQYYYQKNTFPANEVRKDWEDDYSITNLAYGDALWVVIMSK